MIDLINHAFDFAKYGTRYLGASVYRFNRCVHLEILPLSLLVAAVTPWVSSCILASPS